MADENETNDDDKQTPPKPPAKKADEPSLFFLHRLGVYTATALRKVGTVKTTKQVRYETDQLILYPGLNLVDAAELKKVAGNKAFKERCEAQEIEDLTLAYWDRCKPAKALGLIKGSGHVATLEKLLERETNRDKGQREKVIQGLRDHIAECKDTQGKAAAARRAQRAHNRAN